MAQENEQLKEKLEEVSLELDILKNEISDGGMFFFQKYINEKITLLKKPAR